MPSFVTLAVMRSRGRSWKRISAVLGWQLCGWNWYLWGVAIAIGIGAATIATFLLFDPSVLLHPPPGTDQHVYARLGLSAGTVALAFIWEAIFNALGEEVFFRGLRGGWLMNGSASSLETLCKPPAFSSHTSFCWLLAFDSGPYCYCSSLAATYSGGSDTSRAAFCRDG